MGGVGGMMVDGEFVSIDTEEEYRVALKEIWHLMDIAPGTPGGARLEHLVRLIEPYENVHYHIDSIIVGKE
jgi:antitoxin component HigA of HigAB toxin-antitoxin module